ncbi:hypothetical protein NP493_661g04006 [Ridgeia piscesae]|uniref:SAM domain-containing protein n=1 Tax=Ridgeia piscesae TaxID=27915 RepID=A0AAD9NQ21_RIDPI|nr:hypothetical protein NP493_661g04006 [Ridgeia piscesae]
MAAMVAELDYSYDGSDESSENELLDRSLSVWKGGCLENENFLPIPLDLHTAASIGQYDCVHTLITRGDVALNKKNKGGWTALMYASYIGHENIVTLLLKAGVSVNVKSSKGQTPLMLAASCGNEGVAYFLLQADADLEARDKQGWTALFHATSSGHQNMVKFLLDNEANTEAAEPSRDFTPFLEAAAAGHEIIVQYFLLHGVDLNVKSSSGDTARSLAMMAGHTKIVTLIDNHAVMLESSSSDEGGQIPRGHGHRASRSRKVTPCLDVWAGPNIREGPEALAQLFGQGKQQGGPCQPQVSDQRGTDQDPNVCVPKGYMTFPDEGSGSAPTDEISFRDVTSPINPDDYTMPCPTSSEADTEKDVTAFSKTGALTIKSSSGSSGGLVAALGLKNSSDSGNDEESSDSDLHVMGQRSGDTVDQHDSIVKQWQQNHFGDGAEPGTGQGQGVTVQDAVPPGGRQGGKESGLESRPEDLGMLLRQLGLSKYLGTFEEQDVDLQVFLSLTDNDLKEVGIK